MVWRKQTGFSAVQVLLVLVAVAIVGFTGWFVYHSSKAANDTLKSANEVAQSSVPTVSTVSTFDQCKKAAGSAIEQSYPEKCVTKSGKSFTDTSASTGSSAPAKAAADSPTPAAGTCEKSDGATVTVTLAQGVPEPRCSQATAKQTLYVVNPTPQSVTVTLGGQSVTIGAGKTGAISTPFGDYLQTGDHIVQTGLYGDSGPEIYLPAS